jgi:hypothetical protein
MKNKFTLTLLFILTIVVGKTQITEIDARVSEINNLIVESTEQGDPENILPCLETTSRLTRRSIGTVDTQVKIYFKRNDGMYFSEEEQREIETFQAIMQKVEIMINTGSYQLKITYYFDEIGELILAQEDLTDLDLECSSILYYFNQQRITYLKKTVWKYEKPNKKQTVEIDKISLENQLIGQTLLEEVGLLDNFLAAHYLFLILR